MTRARLLVVATTNSGKLRELRQLLRELNLEVRSLSDLVGDAPAVEESGTTFEDNALLKAKASGALTGELSLADDSGLEVDALGGRPGVLSARYAGPTATDAVNLSRVLEELQGVEPERRTARFVCVLALVGEGREPLVVRGVCEGAIALSPRGSQGFGYDPIFVPAARPNSTMAELSLEDKQLVSHRGKAFGALLGLLPTWLANSPA
jgi:XTP/dITP diphosphohydrolase